MQFVCSVLSVGSCTAFTLCAGQQWASFGRLVVVPAKLPAAVTTCSYFGDSWVSGRSLPVLHLPFLIVLHSIIVPNLFLSHPSFPFSRDLKHPIATVDNLLNDLPLTLRQMLKFAASLGFIVPFVLVLWWVIHIEQGTKKQWWRRQFSVSNSSTHWSMVMALTHHTPSDTFLPTHPFSNNVCCQCVNSWAWGYVQTSECEVVCEHLGVRLCVNWVWRCVWTSGCEFVCVCVCVLCERYFFHDWSLSPSRYCSVFQPCIALSEFYPPGASTEHSNPEEAAWNGESSMG